MTIVNENGYNLKVIIFKNAKKAKNYEIRYTKKQGCYSADELSMRVKTDCPEKLIECPMYQTYYKEIK